MISGSDMSCGSLAALAGANDFDVVTGAEPGLRPRRAWDDGTVERDRNSALAGIDRLLLQECRQRRGGERLVLAVHSDARLRGSIGHGDLLIRRRRASG